MLKLFNDDPETESIIMIGEIGGTAEEEAAAWVKIIVKNQSQHSLQVQPRLQVEGWGMLERLFPVVRYAEAKKAALKGAGIAVAETPSEMGSTLASIL